MKIAIVLAGVGGPLATKTVDLPDSFAQADPYELTQTVIDWLREESMLLSPGDTIIITALP